MIDARNFTEICKDLSQEDWLVLRDILEDEMEVATETIYRWRDGKQRPNKLTRTMIAKCLRKTLKLNVTAISLFP